MSQSAPTQPLRIALFTALYSPFLSGITVAVHHQVRWLLQRGHYVCLIHPQCNEQYPEYVRQRKMPGLEELQSFPGFQAYAYPTKPLRFYKSLPEPLSHRHWSDTELLEGFQPNIILVEEAPQMRGFYSLFLGGYGRPVGMEYARLKHVPNILIFQTDILAYFQYYLGSYLFKLFYPLFSRLVQRFSQAYDKNYFPSKVQLLKYKAMKAQHAEYLPHQGVDCQKFCPQNITHDPLPNDPRPLLLFVGRLAPEKNIAQLLDIFSLIQVEIPDVRFVIVGSGPEEEELRQKAVAFESGVTVWGQSFGPELLGWYARAELFINPSLTENFCNTNLEALASGTPVIAANAGGNSEQIIPGVNGMLVEPNNSIDFAQSAIALLKNPLLQQDLARQARQTALQFDWSNCMKTFEDKLYQLVQEKKESVKTPDS